MRKNRTAEFHKGMDYACVMLQEQSTDTALVRLYGTGQEVQYYGDLIARAINSAAHDEDCKPK